jgi:hypothetical protein
LLPLLPLLLLVVLLLLLLLASVSLAGSQGGIGCHQDYLRRCR